MAETDPFSKKSTGDDAGNRATGPLKVTLDTNVVIDALDGTRAAAVELFTLVRAGALDAAFSTRLEYELQSHSLEDVRELIARDPESLPTTGRYGASRYDGGDTYAADGHAIGGPSLLGSSWRLDFGQLGIDTFLGGGADDLSLPTLDVAGKLGAIDSDHLEAHRRAGRDVFVTSDRSLIKAAQERGLDATTPEALLERLGDGQGRGGTGKGV